MDALSRGESTQRARLGITITPGHVARRAWRRAVGLPDTEGLVLIRDVAEDSPAAARRPGTRRPDRGGRRPASPHRRRPVRRAPHRAGRHHHRADRAARHRRTKHPGGTRPEQPAGRRSLGSPMNARYAVGRCRGTTSELTGHTIALIEGRDENRRAVLRRRCGATRRRQSRSVSWLTRPPPGRSTGSTTVSCSSFTTATSTARYTWTPTCAGLRSGGCPGSAMRPGSTPRQPTATRSGSTRASTPSTTPGGTAAATQATTSARSTTTATSATAGWTPGGRATLSLAQRPARS